MSVRFTIVDVNFLNLDWRRTLSCCSLSLCVFVTKYEYELVYVCLSTCLFSLSVLLSVTISGRKEIVSYRFSRSCQDGVKVKQTVDKHLVSTHISLSPPSVVQPYPAVIHPPSPSPPGRDWQYRDNGAECQSLQLYQLLQPEFDNASVMYD